MRQVEKLNVEYVGYQEPETEGEVQMEILGLEAAICGIKHRIATLRQGVHLNTLMQTTSEEKSNAEIIASPQQDVPQTE